MMNLNNRIEKLESDNKPKVPIEWTPEEQRFRDDIHSRMEKAGATFYNEVCNDDEFDRIKQQSSKAAFIWFLDNQEKDGL